MGDVFPWAVGGVALLVLLRRYSVTNEPFDNWPPVDTWWNLVRLAWYRQRLPDGVGFTSAYRSPQVNLAVGGVGNSNHQRGLSLDLVPGTSGLSLYELRTAAIRAGFAVAIVEEGKGHVHCEINP